jgi:B-box zinc finger
MIQKESVSNENYDCGRHPGRPIEYFCIPCNIGVCIKCMFQDHNGHRLAQMDEAYQMIVEGRVHQTDESYAETKLRYQALTAEVTTAKEEMLRH